MHTERPEKLLTDTYSEAIVENYSIAQVCDILGELRFENAKIVISGKEILSRGIFNHPVSALMKDAYMKTSY